MATAQQEIQEQNKTRKYPTPGALWERFIGKRLVIQTKGHVIITGTFREYTSDHFLAFDQPTIRGHRTAKPPEVYVELAQVGHFHEECELEPKQKSERAKSDERNAETGVS